MYCFVSEANLSGFYDFCGRQFMYLFLYILSYSLSSFLSSPMYFVSSHYALEPPFNIMRKQRNEKQTQKRKSHELPYTELVKFGSFRTFSFENILFFLCSLVLFRLDLKTMQCILISVCFSLEIASHCTTHCTVSTLQLYNCMVNNRNYTLGWNDLHKK